MSIEIRQAVQAYNLLNGVFCVYKPKLVSFKRLRSMLLERVSQSEFKREKISDPKLILFKFCFIE